MEPSFANPIVVSNEYRTASQQLVTLLNRHFPDCDSDIDLIDVDSVGFFVGPAFQTDDRGYLSSVRPRVRCDILHSALVAACVLGTQVSPATQTLAHGGRGFELLISIRQGTYTTSISRCLSCLNASQCEVLLLAFRLMDYLLLQMGGYRRFENESWRPRAIAHYDRDFDLVNNKTLGWFIRELDGQVGSTFLDEG